MQTAGGSSGLLPHRAGAVGERRAGWAALQRAREVPGGRSPTSRHSGSHVGAAPVVAISAARVRVGGACKTERRQREREMKASPRAEEWGTSGRGMPSSEGKRGRRKQKQRRRWKIFSVVFQVHTHQAGSAPTSVLHRPKSRHSLKQGRIGREVRSWRCRGAEQGFPRTIRVLR